MSTPRVLVYAGRTRVDPLPPDCGILNREPAPEERDRLYEAELIVVLDPETFPFRDLEDATRDVPLLIVAGASDPSSFREWTGPFDRIVGSEGNAGGDDLKRLLNATGDTSHARRAKTVHRIDGDAVSGALDAFPGTVESGPRVFEALDGDEPSLSVDPGVGYERCSAGDLASGRLSGSGFDGGICRGLLRYADDTTRTKVLAGAWRAVRPGGRIVLVETFVFDRESRERMTTPPTSVSGYVEDVLEATSGRVTLDFMRSLKYPPDEVHRAAILSLRRL